jgi:hypothetical protein
MPAVAADRTAASFSDAHPEPETAVLKAVGYALLSLLVGSLLAAAAIAEEKKPPGNAGSTERTDYCWDLNQACEKKCDEDWAHAPNVFLPTCKEVCTDDYRECVYAKVRFTLRNSFFDLLQSPGVLDESDLEDFHTTPVGGLTATEVEHACSRVDGVFGRTENGFGCINRKCDDKGSCVLVCYGRKCEAITPDALPDRITLIGILQNGDGVDRRKPALTPDSPDDDDNGGGSGECEENCDGGDIIF